MGKECFCDYCRKSVPVETGLQAVKIGDTELGEACFNCASTLGQGMRKAMAETQKQFSAAMQPAAPAAPAPAAPATETLPKTQGPAQPAGTQGTPENA